MPGLVPGSHVSRTVRKQHGGKKCGLASRATLIQRQANWGAMISAGRPILITVHGIRTFGEWQERLQRLVRRANPDIDIKSYRHGYFSVIAFLIPIFRSLAVRSFRNRLRDIIRENPGSPISIVCHSCTPSVVR
jgi:hypothetical protein